LGGWMDVEAEVMVERERERIKLTTMAEIKSGALVFHQFCT